MSSYCVRIDGGVDCPVGPTCQFCRDKIYHYVPIVEKLPPVSPPCPGKNFHSWLQEEADRERGEEEIIEEEAFNCMQTMFE